MDDGKIRVMIVDDNLAAIEVLAAALASHYGTSTAVTATATNSRDAERILAERLPDLLFLDVELPDISGLDYATSLRERYGTAMKIVMYTSYEKYMIGALRANAFDFLLKPLDETELATVMSRYVTSHAADVVAAAPVEPMQRGSKPLLVTSYTNEKLVLRPSDIGYFKYVSDRKRWEVVLGPDTRHPLFGHTTADDILGYGEEFVRIHKTFIININYLATINDTTCLMLPPFDNIEEIKVSKNFRKDLVERFYSL